MLYVTDVQGQAAERADAWLTALSLDTMLTMVADKADHAGVVLEHFVTWFKLSHGVDVTDAYPGLVGSHMLALYAPEFEAHCEARICQLAWVERDDFAVSKTYAGQFTCAAAPVEDENA